MRDEVDELVDAWRRERPDLDITPLALLSRVTRLARHLDRTRRVAFGEHELDLDEFDALAALRRSGEPYQLTPGQLARATLVSSGTVTHRVDKLENRGLVQRRPDAGDGRMVWVRLTPAGRDRVDAALAALLERERALLAGLSDSQIETTAATLRRVAAPIEAAAGEAAPGRRS